MIGVTLIHVPALGSANLIEILWTVFGLAGLCVVAPNLWDAISNLETLVYVTGERRAAAGVLALGHVRRELLRVVKLLMLLLVGVVAMGQSSPNTITVAGLFVTVSFFVISGLVSGQSLLDRRDRAHVRELLRPYERPSSG